MALTDQTFLQLITRLAHELNDAMSLAATSNGSTTTFVDNVNINSSRESYGMLAMRTSAYIWMTIRLRMTRSRVRRRVTVLETLCWKQLLAV